MLLGSSTTMPRKKPVPGDGQLELGQALTAPATTAPPTTAPSTTAPAAPQRGPIVLRLGARDFAVAAWVRDEGGVSIYRIVQRDIKAESVAATLARQARGRVDA